ncbi:MAG TPA: hypothetical protein VLF91_02500 [Candidatus Saccharimonadales bacterium]|nr:hypothetical protein [Candidatus Saccharimonadales bacterium]
MSERVYIAASFEQRDEVRELYDKLRTEGHIITADWTVHQEIAQLDSVEEREALKARYAVEDTNGVRSASVFALLLGPRKSTGAHIELGIALGARVARICLIGEPDQSQLFYDHPGITTVPNVEAFINSLRPHSTSQISPHLL